MACPVHCHWRFIQFPVRDGNEVLQQIVLVPLLDGVIETRKLLKAEGEKRRKAFLQSVRSTSDEAQLSELLKKYRADRAAKRENRSTVLRVSFQRKCTFEAHAAGIFIRH